MSQIILDDQLSRQEVLIPIAKWATVQQLRDLRPGEVIKDERVPALLQQLKQPTFITIDDGFWDKSLVSQKYCILYFYLRSSEQALIPKLLKQLLKMPEFRTRVIRAGKVGRISTVEIDYWQQGDQTLHVLSWPKRKKIG